MATANNHHTSTSTRHTSVATGRHDAADERSPRSRARSGDHPAGAAGVPGLGAVGIDSPQLLRRAQAGDRDAFGELYRRHHQILTRYVTTRMRHLDQDAVPDLVHDAFCQALQDLAAATDDVQGWLLRLAARQCTRHDWFLRRYLRTALTVHEGQRSRTLTPAAAAPVDMTQVGHLLAGLSGQERRAVQLRFLEGQPRQLAAQLMGTTPGAVRRLERQALSRLRDAAGLADPADGGTR